MPSATTRNRANRVDPDGDLYPPRFKRLRRLAWLLDRSIPIGGYRIGLDPLIGLLPGGGDLLGGLLSLVILYDAARLGLPVRVLLRMVGNILLETIVGTVPVLGDLFDFAWQANVRNLRLAEEYYDSARPPRSVNRVVFSVVFLAGAVIAGAAVASFLLLVALWRLISGLGVS